MKLLFLAFLASLPLAFACEVKLPQQLLVLSDDEVSAPVGQFTECPEELSRELLRTLQGLEGRIQAQRLVSMLRARGFEKFRLEPPLVQVQQLRHLVRDQLQLPAGVHVRATRGVNTGQLVALAAGDQVEVSCVGCLWGSQQPLNVLVREFDGNRRSLFASADFRKMVRAYRLTNSLASFAAITPADVKEEYVESVPYTDLVTDAETLRFFKSNKPLRAGELLRASDLNAQNLVRAGMRTEVILENEMVRIKTSGISRSSGGFGETVEVFHQQKNKKYQGKVIDNNKVLVEL